MCKNTIMEMANNIIDVLSFCDDSDFIDEVIARIASADWFSEEEIADAFMK